MIDINRLPEGEKPNGTVLFRSQGAAQGWVRQQVRDSDRNYFVGFRDRGDHGHSFGVMFGVADWVPEGQQYVKDIFPRVVH